MPESRLVDFGPTTREKIIGAVRTILAGHCNRVDVSKDVKVYECKNVIRIDLKVLDMEESK